MQVYQILSAYAPVIKKLFLILILLFRFVQAQPWLDLAAFRYHRIASGDDSVYSETTWANGELSMPVKIKEDVLIVNTYFERYDFASGGGVYGVSVPIAYSKQLKNPDWKTAVSFIPRIHSDFKNISRDDYQIGGAVLFTKKKKDELKFKFGAYYNSEFFGFFMLPLAGIDWNISSRLNLFGVLPNSMTLEFKLFPGKIHTGLAFKSITNSYRMDDGSYLTLRDNHLKAFADAYFLKNIVINAEGGHTVLRKYEAGIKAGGSNSETELADTNGFIFRMAVSYRLRLDQPGK